MNDTKYFNFCGILFKNYLIKNNFCIKKEKLYFLKKHSHLLNSSDQLKNVNVFRNVLVNK